MAPIGLATVEVTIALVAAFVVGETQLSTLQHLISSIMRIAIRCSRSRNPVPHGIIAENLSSRTGLRLGDAIQIVVAVMRVAAICTALQAITDFVMLGIADIQQGSTTHPGRVGDAAEPIHLRYIVIGVTGYHIIGITQAGAAA